MAMDLALVPRLFRMAREIVCDGGDPDPCELGAYCLRCCLALAKTDLDAEFGTVFGLDWVLVSARDAASRLGDEGIAHSRESALAMLDRLIQSGGL
jgi:hypothetical protein